MMKKILMIVAVAVLCHAAVAQAANVVRVGEDMEVHEGLVLDDVVVIGGNLTVNGVVRGDTVVIGGNLIVGQYAKVLGDTVVLFGKIVKAPGAEIVKNVVEVPLDKGILAIFAGLFSIMGLWTLGLFGLAMVMSFVVLLPLIAIIFTANVGRTSFYVQTHPWKSCYYGFIVALLLVPVNLFLAITVIGLPLIPLVVIVLCAAILFGYTVMCQFVGLKFFKAIKKKGQPMVIEVIVGLLILWAVAMVPFVGWLIKAFIWLTGLGATVATKFGYLPHKKG